MEVHRNLDTNLKFVCKICNAQYGRSFALNDHIKTAHGEQPDEVSEEHYIIEEDESEANTEDSVVIIPKK
jgi:hypothetical protein